MCTSCDRRLQGRDKFCVEDCCLELSCVLCNSLQAKCHSNAVSMLNCFFMLRFLQQMKIIRDSNKRSFRFVLVSPQCD
jgi:hypothetical protein